MDNTTLKKRLSTYKSEGGHLKNVSDELLMDILQAWEAWVGPASGFYVSIGVSQRQMAKLMGKAKKLKRDGVFPENEFKEIKFEPAPSFSGGPCGIEIAWENGKLIRFAQVDQLVDFLKKVA